MVNKKARASLFYSYLVKRPTLFSSGILNVEYNEFLLRDLAAQKNATFQEFPGVEFTIGPSLLVSNAYVANIVAEDREQLERVVEDLFANVGTPHRVDGDRASFEASLEPYGKTLKRDFKGFMDGNRMVVDL